MGNTEEKTPPMIVFLGMAVVVTIGTLPFYFIVHGIFRLFGAEAPNTHAGVTILAYLITTAALAGFLKVRTPMLLTAVLMNVVFVATWMLAALLTLNHGYHVYKHRACWTSLVVGLVPLLALAVVVWRRLRSTPVRQKPAAGDATGSTPLP